MMKNSLLIGFLIFICYFFNTELYAQAPNDSCYQAINITQLDGSCNDYSIDSLAYDLANPSCAPDITNPNMWFTFTAQGSVADVTINQTGVSFSIIQFANPCTFTDAREVACSNDGTMTATNLQVGFTYYIVVSNDADLEGNITLCVDNPPPPPNDSPCNAESVANEGCATGTTVGASSDYVTPNCGNTVFEQTVFYKVTLGNNTDKLQVALTSQDITGNVGIAILQFPNGCNGQAFLASNNSYYCGPIVDTVTFEDMPEGEEVYIMISTSHVDAGDFNFCIHEVEKPPQCAPNGDCATAQNIDVPNLAETVCVDGCNTGMPDGPNFGGSGPCANMTNPTAWFSFTTTNNQANLAIFDLTSTDLTNPVFAVMSDCNTMIACNPVEMNVLPNTTYYIAITDANGATGDFEFCVTLIKITDPCITEQTFKVVSTSLGSPTDGPYKPCEEIGFEYKTNFIKLGAQWIHSMFPVIDDCFDYTQGDEPTPSTRPTGNASWDWYPAGTVHWKPLDNSNGQVGIDPGTGKLCIIGTSGCQAFYGEGNCSWGGTEMPAGWIGVSYSGTCSSSVPNLSWGDNAPGPFTVKFSLKIPCDACTNTACLDKYRVGITAFADGQTGGWQSSACNGHTLKFLKLAIKCCIPPTITVEDGTTCSDVPFFANITLDPPNATIEWTVVETNGVTGATNGSGTTFSQTLHNPSTTAQVVHYTIIAIGSDGCESDPVDLFVTVLPAVIADGGPDKTSCPGATVTLGGNPTGSGGDGGPYTYNWSNGQTTETIDVTPSITTIFTLTVTDGSGCTGTDQVKVTVNAQIDVQIDPKPLEYCLSQLDGKTMTANSNATNNPIDYLWRTPWGDQTGKTIPILGTVAGTYTITVKVTDAIGCTGVGTAPLILYADPPVTILNKPTGNLCEGTTLQLESSPSAQDGTVFSSVPSGVVSPTGLLNTNVMDPSIQYTIYATYTDPHGCIGKDSFVVSSIHIDDPYITPAGPYCADDVNNYQLTATPAGGTFSGPGVSGSGVFIPYSLGGPGQYEISYTVGTPDCNKTDTMLITINPVPAPQVLPPYEYCETDSPDPILTGLPLNGTWSGTIVDQYGTIDLGNILPGVYDVTYTVTESGCTGTTTAQITINHQPDATLIPTGSVCNDGQIDPNRPLVDLSTYLTGGDITGFWSEVPPLSGAVNTAGSVWDFTGVPAGTVATFEYTITALPPCQDFTGQVQITVNDDCACPKLDFNTAGDMCNSSATLDLNTLIIDTEPGIWSLTSGPDLSVLSGNIFDATGNAGGTYIVRYTLVPAPSEPLCPKYHEISIKVSEEVKLNMTPQLSICNSSPTDFKTKLDMKKFFIGNVIPGSWINESNVGVVLTNDTINFRNVPVGQYKFTYITNNAVAPCPNDTQTVIVNVTEACNCPTLAVLEPDSKLCNSGGTKDLNTMVSSDKPGSWTFVSDPNGPVNTPFAGIFDATGKTPGTYTFRFEVNDTVPPDCDSILTVTLTVSDQVIIDLLDQLKVCNSSPTPAKTQLDLTKFFGGNSVPPGTWTNDDGVGTLVGGTIYDFSGVPPGTYHFTYTTNNAVAPCQNATETVLVIVTEECDCPDLNILQGSEVLCNDSGTKDLGTMISSSLPGSWTITQDPNGPASTPVPGGIFNATGKTAGIYTFTFEVNDNVPPDCDSTLTVTIDVKAKVDYQLQNRATVCNSDPSNKGSDELDFNSGDIWISATVSGTWDPGTSGAVDLGGGIWSFNGVAKGTYVFTFTPNGAVAPCQNIPQTITIEVTDVCDCPDLPALPKIDSLCNNAANFTLPIPVGAKGSWSVISPVGAGYATITNNVFNINQASQGVYTLRFTYDSIPVGCPYYNEVQVKLSEYKYAGNPTAELNYCQNTSDILDLFEHIDSEDSGGIWTDVTGNAGSAFDANLGIVRIKNLQAGDYIFNYRFNKNGACPGSDADVLVHICPLPQIEAGDSKFLTCQNKSTTIGVSGPSGPDFEIHWVDIKNNNPIPNPDQLVNTITLPGIYVLTVKDKVCGCVSTDTVEVKAEGIPERVDITALGPSCHNFTNGFIKIDSVVGGNPPYLFEFNGSSATAQTNWNNLGAGTYQITMVDATGCRIDLFTTFANPELLKVDLGNDTIIKLGDTVLIDPVITIPRNNVESITYSSDYDFINCTNCFEINVFPNETTTYTVEVKDKNGCIDSDDKRIIVRKGFNIFVPNVFTPNGDGNNDKVIVSTNTKEIRKINSFQIYDRWGEKVYEAKDFQPNDQNYGWDGTFKGGKMNPAVYVYWMEVELFDGTTQIVKGDITLIR